MKLSLMPLGVEHIKKCSLFKISQRNEIIFDAIRRWAQTSTKEKFCIGMMKLSLMPLGVEHENDTGKNKTNLTMKLSLMPLGVYNNPLPR